jgi:uncharacterized membrane protein
MATVAERAGLDPEQAWLGVVGALVVALVGGSLAFPRTVYDGFLWHYFWGPVYADAHGAVCAVRAGGTSSLEFSAAACQAAAEPVAYPGYTIYSEVGYALTLILGIGGVALLLRRLGVDRYPGLFFSLFPFMIFGGALRVVEDASNAAASAGSDALLTYPVNALFISPVIYGTVFLLALAALLVGVALERTGRVAGFEFPVAVLGTVGAVGTVGYLATASLSAAYVEFHPPVLLAVLVGSVAVTAGTWVGLRRLAPEVHAGTGAVGLPVLLGQVVDGVANVVGLDWAAELGLAADLVPKHPVNRAVVNLTDAVLPAAVTQVTGTAWPFLLLKVGAAVFVVWVFDETVMEESPRYSIMLLLAATAVGLGPGTRDALRATFGV